MSESRSVPPLRIAVLGDFDGIHTRRWLEVFVARGHDVHAISYYWPRVELPGVTMHVLSEQGRPHPLPPLLARRGDTDSLSPRERAGVRANVASTLKRLVPPSLQRLLQSQRYMRAGLKRTLDEIQPDVFHAHYAVEHGFYGAFAGFHPYVVSTWGSDLLVESHKSLGKLIARHALARADLVTANDASLASRAAELGVPASRIEVVHLGIDRVFLDAGERSVNLHPDDGQQLTVISTRAHEPLYNIYVVLCAFIQARERVPGARLIVAGTGSLSAAYQQFVSFMGLEAEVQFVGQQTPEALAELLAAAHVYVSVPSSDSLALSNLEAMAAGAFPVVSDLPSIDGWIEHGVTGLRVPAKAVPTEGVELDTAVDTLSAALQTALSDASLRQAAAGSNRAKVEAGGLREANMLLMERHYYRLAGHPQAAPGESI